MRFTPEQKEEALKRMEEGRARAKTDGPKPGTLMWIKQRLILLEGKEQVSDKMKYDILRTLDKMRDPKVRAKARKKKKEIMAAQIAKPTVTSQLASRVAVYSGKKNVEILEQ
jgi:hypothetical protein